MVVIIKGQKVVEIVINDMEIRSRIIKSDGLKYNNS